MILQEQVYVMTNNTGITNYISILERFVSVDGA